MTGERQIDYEALAQSALRSIVRTVLMHVAKASGDASGLPGDHHFYIAFDTGAAGVGLSRRLKERYPDEMTIVLQHRFWNLSVNEERFEVSLTFDGIEERLMVPFSAIKVFFDPSVPYGLQFEGADSVGGLAHEPDGGEALDVRPTYGTVPMRQNDEMEPASARPPAAAKKARKPRSLGKGDGTVPGKSAAKPAGSNTSEPGRPKLVASKPDEPHPPANDTKVVQLDKFRKK